MKLPTVLVFAVLIFAGCELAASEITSQQMQAIYEQVKTPHKVGVVIPAPEGKKVDCPNVFRHRDRWYMVYVQLEPDPRQGYTTQLAVSNDLLTWKPMGAILTRGTAGDWDRANAGGGLALFSTEWGGDNTLETHRGRYWMTYLGGKDYGYEKIPLSIGLASTEDPSRALPWNRDPQPILTVHDADVRSFETGTLYKSFVLYDKDETLGAPFVMYYNAKPANGNEQIGMAVSSDLRRWKRYGDGPVIVNRKKESPNRGAISGDPQIVKMGDIWVMFYFGAFWEPGAFDTFAASSDLVRWTRWTGPKLIEPSESWDSTYAHKPWVIKHEGVVYHFYCAVGEQGRVIALATSKPVTGQKP
jgi:beta-xylosidase